MEVVPWKWSDDDVVRSYETPEHAEKSKQQRKRHSTRYELNYMLITWDDVECETTEG